MKKMLMGLIACALVMTSCSNNEVLESFVDSKNKLSFSVASGKQSATRVAELSTTALQAAADSQDNGIALYAYRNENEDVDGVIMSVGKQWFVEKLWHDSNSNSWEIEGDYYASTENLYYTFITYFPTTNVTEVGNTFAEAYRTSASANDWGENTPKFEYTVQNECRFGFDDNDQIEIDDNTGETQEDLIVGYNGETFGGRAFELEMGHALSQVNFAIKGQSGVTIEVENIFIGGVYNKGTFTYYSELNSLHGTWEVDDEETSTDNYVYKLLNKTIPATAKTGDLYVLGDGGNWGPGRNDNIFYPVGTDNDWISGDQEGSTPMDNSLMLMPQKHEYGGVRVYLKAYMTNEGKKTYLMGSDTEFQPFNFYLRQETNIENDMRNEWEQNYRYLYVIDLSNYIASRKISFTVSVNEWENWNKDSGNDGVIDFPIMGGPGGV